MSLNTEKLTQFAQAVGQDVKQIKLDVADKASTSHKQLHKLRQTLKLKFWARACQNN